MTDIRLENFLLSSLTQDWMPLGEFLFFAARITPRASTPSDVAEVVRELATRGLIELGGWSDDGRFELWDVSVVEALHRIAHGYQGEAGYLNGDIGVLGRTEVFRANLTALGEERLSELGDPYNNYGDPWSDVPHLRTVRAVPPWREADEHP
ncbi:hypothetical protein HQ602_04950 [Rhodococcus kroppenstedtii]|uniref:hypothetical protein n=1 Tax=Rhodococcoides kroppenstedtii TaxID=293050 RepID=UPI001C9B6C21|nr:hypothetical protein [Rhodococcus kroppenstedtii]MBY6435723.1 hypothetical protein [Rhodococcus kroppenstedtii]